MTKEQSKEIRTEIFKFYGEVTFRICTETIKAICDRCGYEFVKHHLKNASKRFTLAEIYKLYKDAEQRVLSLFMELLGPAAYNSENTDMIPEMTMYDYRDLRKCLLAGLSVKNTCNLLRSASENNLSEDMLAAAIKVMTGTGRVRFAEFGEGKISLAYKMKEYYNEIVKPPVVRGEPISVTLWKHERERILELRKKAVCKNPQLEYELHRLNWLIVDNQPKGGRVLRLKIINLGVYHSYSDMLILREKIKNCIKDNQASLELQCRGYGNNPRIWLGPLEGWYNPYEVMHEIERIIRHCGGENYDYGDYVSDSIDRIAKSLGIPAWMAQVPIPDSDSKRRTFINTALGEPWEGDREVPGGFIRFGGCEVPLRQTDNKFYFEFFDDRDLSPLNAALVKRMEERMKSPAFDIDLSRQEVDILSFKLDLNAGDTFFNHNGKTTKMENTNQRSMTKEEKHARIKQISSGLELIKSHRAEIDKLKNEMSLPQRKLQCKLFSSLNDGDDYHAKSVWLDNPQFIKPETMLKLWQSELDDREATLTTELNTLIS